MKKLFEKLGSVPFTLFLRGCIVLFMLVYMGMFWTIKNQPVPGSTAAFLCMFAAIGWLAGLLDGINLLRVRKALAKLVSAILAGAEEEEEDENNNKRD